MPQEHVQGGLTQFRGPGRTPIERTELNLEDGQVSSDVVGARRPGPDHAFRTKALTPTDAEKVMAEDSHLRCLLLDAVGAGLGRAGCTR